VAVDGAENLYISDTNYGRILKVNRTGGTSLSFASTAVGSTIRQSQIRLREQRRQRELDLPIVSSGTSPSLSPGFVFSKATTCPTLASIFDFGIAAGGLILRLCNQLCADGCQHLYGCP